MTHSIEPVGWGEPFSGRAPLFPLPNVVFFPHLLLPLYVFEPRYREMTRDALAGEKLIAMALLKPGWEGSPGQPAGVQDSAGPDSLKAELPHAVPEVFDTVCLGRITSAERQADGRWHLILHGLTRARILDEERDDQPYRTARLELLAERTPAAEELDVETRRCELLAAFRAAFPQLKLETVLHPATSAPVSLGMLCDVLAAAMRPDPPVAQRFLEELDVARRSSLLLEYLRRGPGESVPSGFPPEFSRN